MMTKRKKTTFQKIEDVLNDFAMWHKKLIRKFRKWFNLTDYKLLWISFTKGLLLGIALVIFIG